MSIQTTKTVLLSFIDITFQSGFCVSGVNLLGGGSFHIFIKYASGKKWKQQVG